MKERIISAIVMIAILLPIVLAGGELFALLAAVIGCLGLRELIALKRSEKEIPFLTEVMAYLATIYMVFTNYASKELIFSVDYRLICVLIFVFLIPTVLVGNNKRYSFKDGLYLLGASLLIGFAFNLAVLIRNYSLTRLKYLLLIATFTDTFALVTGKFIGKHKLCPEISPKKTVEGAIGGAIMGTFMGMVYYTTFISSNVDLVILFIVTITLSFIGQLGDLIFSQIKRNYKIKDFSNLIPGHGGVLDRLDSMIFIILMFTLFINVI